jgi:hypothetical protein
MEDNDEYFLVVVPADYHWLNIWHDFWCQVAICALMTDPLEILHCISKREMKNGNAREV